MPSLLKRCKKALVFCTQDHRVCPGCLEWCLLVCKQQVLIGSAQLYAAIVTPLPGFITRGEAKTDSLAERKIIYFIFHTRFFFIHRSLLFKINFKFDFFFMMKMVNYLANLIDYCLFFSTCGMHLAYWLINNLYKCNFYTHILYSLDIV